MALVKLICRAIVCTSVVGIVMVVVPGPVQAQKIPECQILSEDNQKIPEEQTVAAGTTVKVECRLEQSEGKPTWKAKSELVGSSKWAVVDGSGEVHPLAPYDSEENAVDLSRLTGSLVLKLEGVAPLHRVPRSVVPSPEDGTPQALTLLI